MSECELDLEVDGAGLDGCLERRRGLEDEKLFGRKEKFGGECKGRMWERTEV